jgi:hypothetical protein
MIWGFHIRLLWGVIHIVLIQRKDYVFNKKNIHINALLHYRIIKSHIPPILASYPKQSLSNLAE